MVQKSKLYKLHSARNLLISLSFPSQCSPAPHFSSILFAKISKYLHVFIFVLILEREFLIYTVLSFAFIALQNI